MLAGPKNPPLRHWRVDYRILDNLRSLHRMAQSMTESATLLNSQISFLVRPSLDVDIFTADIAQDTHVALVHIPLPLYPLFMHAISQLLLHNDRKDAEGRAFKPARPWHHWYPFVNVSVTATECSIVCPREHAEQVFTPLLGALDPAARRLVTISREDFSVIVIGGAGLEAGQRVLDLTGPLALSGIPIFFITSYWSDFILVPLKARSRVISALEDRGFVFEAEENGEAGHMTNPASPLMHPHHRDISASSSDFPPTPSTPPPATVPELQVKTFKTLAKNNIDPSIEEGLILVTCAGSKDSTADSQATSFTEGKLQHGLLKCLTSAAPPHFLSITLTDTESASVTLDKNLLHHFANEGEDLLLGKDGPEQVAVTFDLSKLPEQSTGIVCGVASRLIDGMKGRMSSEIFNMSYLSTARAGHVIVYEDELQDALKALRGMHENGVNGVHLDA